MTDWESSDQASTAIRSGTLRKLEAVALVREMQVIDLLDEIVEAARARLSPRAKPASEKGAKRGPKAAT